ncbi:hypothetical protein [Marinilabilia rubra]|uniref:Uncharacterized protein n=1 Tax=Marinilabilia rubra TaxID=2162893 RepID=A0A2U2B421_9BACT|nr:hypothetical protein [Marinilabilia rubra]PWD97787.1 hypothetical protein DDZ16_18885 [Marinilabilia rubra]
MDNQNRLSFTVNRKILVLLLVLLPGLGLSSLNGQVKVAPTGNVTGIMVDDQLVEFTTRLCVVEAGWGKTIASGKDVEHSTYSMEEGKHIIETTVDGVQFVEEVEDKGDGFASIKVRSEAETDKALEGAFLQFEMTGGNLDAGYIWMDPEFGKTKLRISEIVPKRLGGPASFLIRSFQIDSGAEKLNVDFGEDLRVFVMHLDENEEHILRVFVKLMGSDLNNGDVSLNRFEVEADLNEVAMN